MTISDKLTEYRENPFELTKSEKPSPKNYKEGVKFALDEMHSEIEKAVEHAAHEIDKGEPVAVTIPLAYDVRWTDDSSPAMRLFRKQFPKAMKDISELCREQGLKAKIQLNEPDFAETAADCQPASLNIAFSKSTIKRPRKMRQPEQSLSNRILYLAKDANSDDIAEGVAMGFAGVAVIGIIAGGAYLMCGADPAAVTFAENL